MLKKLKSLILDDTVYIACLLVLTAVFSFGLGTLSVGKVQKEQPVGPASVSLVRNVPSPVGPVAPVPNNVSPAASSAPTIAGIMTNTSTAAQNFVASKAGTKYHALTCPGAKTIKESNKIYFATVNDAEAAGYTRAANCPLR